MKSKIIFLMAVLMCSVIAGHTIGQVGNDKYITNNKCDANIACTNGTTCGCFPDYGCKCYAGGDPNVFLQCEDDEIPIVAEVYPPRYTCMNTSDADDEGAGDTVTYNVQTGEVTTIKNKIKEKIQNAVQQITEQVEGYEGITKEVYQAKNPVREAVHYFLAFPEEITEKNLGQQISQIAKEFNNSVQAQINAEEKVREREGILKFLFGYDENAVKELEEEQETLETQVQEMQEVSTELSTEEQEFVQEQLQVMQEDQDRVTELIKEQKKDKGILGWLFK